MIWGVRHLAADAPGLCYGWTDVPLRQASMAGLSDLASRLAALAPSRIVSSDLDRCAVLARAVARQAGCPLSLDPRWRERHFGAWEARGWDAIHAEDGGAIDRLMDPGFAPPGGESLLDLGRRVQHAWHDTPDGALVVAHGGSLAAARCLIAGRPLADAFQLIIAPGDIVALA